MKEWRHEQWICTFHIHVYWQNECPHEERRMQPPSPPKPKTTRVLDVVGEVIRWTNTSREDLVHLDCRSRWILLDADENNPDHFKCPFRECERTYETASECADHVHQEKHKSEWSTLIEKNTSSNSLPVFSRKLSWIVFICLKNCLFWEILNLNLTFAENVTPQLSPFSYCASLAKGIKKQNTAGLPLLSTIIIKWQ